MRKNKKRVLSLSLAALVSVTALFGCTNTDVTPTQTSTTSPVVNSATTPLDEEDPMLPVTRPVEGNTDNVAQIRLYNLRGNWMKAFETENGMFFAADNIGELLDQLRKQGLDSQKLDLSAYDDAFFAEYRLIVIPRRTSSGSVRFSAKVENADGFVRIATVGKMPQVGTADMADWLVLVPLSRADYPGKVKVDDVGTKPSNTQRYAVHRF